MSGVHFRSHCILMQLKLVDAIKEAGNIKRFLPSEFVMDPARMGDALEPCRISFDEKMQVRKAIEDANIPFTYVSANCFAGYFAGNLSQAASGTLVPPKDNLLLYGDRHVKAVFVDEDDEKMEVRKAIEDAKIPFTYISSNCLAGYLVGGLSQLGTLLPPKDNLILYGDGNVKAVFVDDDDVATYTIKTIDDPKTLNKTLYMRPPDNILSQRELMEMWEKLIGKELNKKSISGPELLDMRKDVDFATQLIICRAYHIFFDGCLTNFEVGEDEEASKLYLEVEYKRMDEFLKIYAPN